MDRFQIEELEDRIAPSGLAVAAEAVAEAPAADAAADGIGTASDAIAGAGG